MIRSARGRNARLRAPKNLSAFGPMEVHPFLAVLEGLAALVPAEDKKSKDPSGG